MKMQKILLAALPLLAMPLSAQDIYKMESFGSEDLNGTARFVGMGGAMSSLGADLSTMGTNPAGTALYRRSDIAMSGGFNVQPGAIDFANRGKTHASFDQAGFVYACRMGEDKLRFINFGFNYHKRRNAKNYVGVDNFRTGGLSQSLQMLDLTYVRNGWLDLTNNNDRTYTTPLTLAGFDTQLLDRQTDADGKVTGYLPSEAQSYNYRRVQWGGIQQYDFNMSMNWNDQIYAGLTFGLYNVDMHSALDYGETLTDPSTHAVGGDYYMQHDEALSGTGFDIKLGLIMRPFEDSPFRFGVSFSSPVFFDLSSTQKLYLQTPYQQKDDAGNVTREYSDTSMDPGENDYRIRTPWKFNISMGTTVGNFLALGAEYEYRDMSTSQVRYGDDGGDYGGIWDTDTKDEGLAAEAKRFLKPVSTIRLGAEARLMEGVYARLGYNYESAPIDKNAFLNLFADGPSYYYACTTDYLNLSAINRITAGLGLRGKHFYLDMAYQYRHQTGDLYAFHVPQQTSDLNRLAPTKVDLNRHQVLFTLGYKF